jgi:D-arabinose 1-dehydrogenase-like Zn-dependent alcohol dehydrogenase
MVSVLVPLSNLQGPLPEPIKARDVGFGRIGIMGSLVGNNWTPRETLEFAAKVGVRAKVICFGLSGLNELVEVYKRGEGRKLVVDMDLVV